MVYPKVSILVPIYNVEKYISNCLINLFEQTYINLEYIFVDDCSQDNSISIMNEILLRYPFRKQQVRVVKHDVNKGLGVARNTAVFYSTGDFILHVDSDDYIEKNTVEKLVNKQAEEDFDIVSCDFLAEYSSSTRRYKVKDYSCKDEYIVAILKQDCFSQIWGRLIRTSLYKDNNIEVSMGCNMGEDLQVVPRLLYFADKVGVIHEPLFHYRCDNENSYTSNFALKSEISKRQAFHVLKGFFSDKDIKFIDAQNIGELKNLLASIFGMARRSVYNSFYKESIMYLSQFDRKYYQCLNYKQKITFKLASCRFILVIYATFAHFFNVYINKMLSK